MNVDDSLVIVILTCNGEKTIKELLESLKEQEHKGEIVVIDSESDDSTMKIISEMDMDIKVKSISRKEFNHGATRQMAVNMYKDAEYYVFLTQDVILAEKIAIEKLIDCFKDEKIGCAYGRQLPHKNAGILGRHARIFNYPGQNQIRKMEDAKKWGIKTVFISDSFAAYRRTALDEVGGFPQNVILSEDTYVAAKMLINGWNIFYCAEAKVYHSHDYTVVEEFKRYFDIGAFHAREFWIQKRFGKAEKEGRKFILSEINYIFQKENPIKICSVFGRMIIKYAGYFCGKHEKSIPNPIKAWLSMTPNFWKTDR